MYWYSLELKIFNSDWNFFFTFDLTDVDAINHWGNISKKLIVGFFNFGKFKMAVPWAPGNFPTVIMGIFGLQYHLGIERNWFGSKDKPKPEICCAVLSEAINVPPSNNIFATHFRVLFDGKKSFVVRKPRLCSCNFGDAFHFSLLFIVTTFIHWKKQLSLRNWYSFMIGNARNIRWYTRWEVCNVT